MKNMARQSQMALCFKGSCELHSTNTPTHRHAVGVAMEMLMPYYGMHKWQEQASLQPEDRPYFFCKTFRHLSQTPILCQPTTLFRSNPKGRVKKEKEWKNVEGLKKRLFTPK